MSLQYATSTRNAKLDAIETDVGTSPHLKIWTGSVPANPAAADSGTNLVDMTLPSDWMAAAASGSKAMLGTWSGTGLAVGAAGYFRIYTSGGVCKLQGTCGIGSGDLQLDNTAIAVGQAVQVTSFTVTEGNA